MNKVEAIVRDILEKHTYCRFENGRYIDEIYVAYDDKMSDRQVLQISQAKKAREDLFYELLDGYVVDRTDEEEDLLIKEIEEHWPEPENDEDEAPEFSWDDVHEVLMDLVDFLFPYDHYKKTPVHVNIIVNTGDGNYDFTLNNWLDRDATIEDASALFWLCKQQGYGKRAVKKAMAHTDFQESAFLKSLYAECANVATSMNALTFLVEMTLGEYMGWMDHGGDLVVSKETTCGLYDPWNGAGSLLEIDLEKDVRIPHRFAEPHIDGARGYSINSIYAPWSGIWGNTVLESKPAKGAKK